MVGDLGAILPAGRPAGRRKTSGSARSEALAHREYMGTWVHKMSGKRRATAQIARDRREIADLYRRGWKQAEIAEKLTVTQSTVSRDLVAIQKEWIKSTLFDFDAARGRELARIDALERQYWAVWDRSLDEVERSTLQYKAKDGKPGGAPVVAGETIRKDPGLGNLQALAGIQWCIDRRCKLLGLDAPTKLMLTSDEIDDEIERELARLARLGKGAVSNDAPSQADAGSV